MDEGSAFGSRREISRRGIFETFDDGLLAREQGDQSTVVRLGEQGRKKQLAVFPLPLWPTMTVKGE